MCSTATTSAMAKLLELITNFLNNILTCIIDDNGDFTSSINIQEEKVNDIQEEKVNDIQEEKVNDIQEEKVNIEKDNNSAFKTPLKNNKKKLREVNRSYDSSNDEIVFNYINKRKVPNNISDSDISYSESELTDGSTFKLQKKIMVSYNLNSGENIDIYKENNRNILKKFLNKINTSEIK
jgi:FKBP-type peptidyl-prolyl cis-trans isomerase